MGVGVHIPDFLRCGVTAAFLLSANSRAVESAKAGFVAE